MVDIVNITNGINNLNASIINSFSAGEGWSVLKPVILFIISMVVYAIFIFKLYRFIAKKDIFELDLEKYNKLPLGILRKAFSVLIHFVKYILIFPFFTFFWFLVFTLLLSFLAKNQLISNILLVSISVVAAVRITAYYNEDLSRDLAKMLPFALLGVFLVDVTFFSASRSLGLIKQIPSLWRVMAYYLLFVIALELVLRLLYILARPFVEDKNKK